jgi:hypothetical protein
MSSLLNRELLNRGFFFFSLLLSFGLNRACVSHFVGHDEVDY